jgi:hypothetical protein
MFRCDAINEVLRSNVSLVTQCDTAENGMLRIATAFRYPDGSHVDIFLDQRSTMYVLSDLGETTAYLFELGIRLWESRRRRSIVTDVCRDLRIQREGGQLQVQVAELDHAAFADALLRLAQACIRISDIALTLTHRSVNDFRDQVEDFIETNHFRYEAGHTVVGLEGNEVHIDFRVEGLTRVSMVQTLTAANEHTARHQAESVFAKWYDIRESKDGNQFVTVCDSSTDVFSGPELRRLQDFSRVIRFPAQDQVFLASLAT